MPGDPPDFYGKSAEEADDFIQAIHKIARDSGRSRDPEWMADLANVAFKGNARRWFNTLTFEQKHDWEKLEEALLQKYSPSDPATNPSNPISNPNTNPWNPISVPNTNPWDPNANSPKPNTNPPWNPISGPNTNPSNPLSGSGNYPVNSNPTSDSSPSTDPQNTITRRVKFVVRHDGVRDTFYFDKHSDPDSMRGFILTRKAADALIVNFTVEQGEAYGTLAIDAPPDGQSTNMFVGLRWTYGEDISVGSTSEASFVIIRNDTVTTHWSGPFKYHIFSIGDDHSLRATWQEGKNTFLLKWVVQSQSDKLKAPLGIIARDTYLEQNKGVKSVSGAPGYAKARIYLEDV